MHSMLYRDGNLTVCWLSENGNLQLAVEESQAEALARSSHVNVHAQPLDRVQGLDILRGTTGDNTLDAGTQD